MKTILVTGATSGIGLEACVQLATQGHRVVLVGRDEAKTKVCVEEVKRRSSSGSVEYVLGDFASLASVRALAESVRSRYPRLDVLVNNAGAVFSKRAVTVDGYEQTFAVNHLAPFLLTNLLLDVLKQSAPARVVMVSSAAQYSGTMDLEDPGFERGGYAIFAAYARSKLANVMMMKSLVKRLEGTKVTVTALHPGAVATNIWKGIPGWAKPLIAVLQRLVMLTPEEGARTITYLASAPDVEGVTGEYFEKNRPRKVARLARDEALCERLWETSARLVKLT